MKVCSPDNYDARQVLRYCPRCGAQDFSSEDDHRFCCARCSFVFFCNVAAAVGVVLVADNGQVLLGVRGRDPGKGLLDLPGGFVDIGEGVEEAARREIREELQLELTELKYLCSGHNRYVYGGIRYHTCDVFFTARALDLTPLMAGDDVASVAWHNPHTLDLSRIAFPSAALALATYRSAL